MPSRARSTQACSRRLSDDLNTPLALSRLTALDDPAALKASAQLLGLLTKSSDEWFQGDGDGGDIEARIAERAEAKENRDFADGRPHPRRAEGRGHRA